MPKIVPTLIAAVSLAALAFTTPARADDDRDECKGPQTIRLVNGKIHTMDAKDRVVSSVLIRGGRFAAVGGESDGGDCVKSINLRGRTVVPGIIDNHNHIVLLGLRPGRDTRLENANSIQEALDTLAARAAGVPAGEWVTSIGGFSRNQFFPDPQPTRFPTLTELSTAVPNHPVFIMESFFGPGATNALGKAFFDSHGETVGADGSVAAGTASLTALFELRKMQTLETQKRGLQDAMRYAASVGITTHLDQGGFPALGNNTDGAANFDRYRAFDSLRALHHEGKLTNRIWLNFLHLEEDPQTPELQARLNNTFNEFGDRMLRILGIGEFTAGPFTLPGGASWQNGTRLVAKAGWRNENHSLSATDFKIIIDNWKIIHDELVASGNADGMQISTMSPWINLYYVVTGKNARGVLINAGQQLTRKEGQRVH